MVIRDRNPPKKRSQAAALQLEIVWKNLIENTKVTDGIQDTPKTWHKEKIEQQRCRLLSLKKNWTWGKHNFEGENSSVHAFHRNYRGSCIHWLLLPGYVFLSLALARSRAFVLTLSHIFAPPLSIFLFKTLHVMRRKNLFWLSTVRFESADPSEFCEWSVRRRRTTIDMRKKKQGSVLGKVP